MYEMEFVRGHVEVYELSGFSDYAAWRYPIFLTARSRSYTSLKRQIA